MPLNTWFWVIYVIALLFSWWTYYEPGQPWLRRAGGYTALWLLVGILGWKVFGAAVK